MINFWVQTYVDPEKFTYNLKNNSCEQLREFSLRLTDGNRNRDTCIEYLTEFLCKQKSLTKLNLPDILINK